MPNCSSLFANLSIGTEDKCSHFVVFYLMLRFFKCYFPMDSVDCVLQTLPTDMRALQDFEEDDKLQIKANDVITIIEGRSVHAVTLFSQVVSLYGVLWFFTLLRFVR